MVARSIEPLNLEVLMRTYGNDVLRTAYLYVKDLHLAEDIFQEVFIKVSLHYGQFRGDCSIKTWLLQITINTCKDYLKSAWNQRVEPTEEFQTQQFMEEGYDRIEKKEDQKVVKKAVMDLPNKYKEVILCVYYQEMSIEETAVALQIAAGTVKSRLSRARQKMKELLERRGSYEKK
ncbi:sigma-70 family RNA polymerase sigma factor [Anaerosporobacter faecicola]|uniref:sigma-70 family RNA polymerase sigma factor n=1 Tax=Anaerosporobacter faecicola TaxID=2718714 RepID=UPI00143CB1F1|nr:sigma-70 family RNA polymerase sigma factor [Anaerosporobacter faecicola]